MTTTPLPGRREFLALLTPHVTPAELRSIKHAYLLSKVAHKGQERDQGGRYFDHPKSVALILMTEVGTCDAEMVIAALLHDVIEDTDLRDGDLFTDLFGDWVVLSLGWLTKRPGYDYHGGLMKADWRTLMVKLADRVHNVRTMGEIAEEKRTRKLRETREEYLPLADRLVEITPDEHKDKARKLRRLLNKAVDAYDEAT